MNDFQNLEANDEAADSRFLQVLSERLNFQ